MRCDAFAVIEALTVACARSWLGVGVGTGEVWLELRIARTSHEDKDKDKDNSKYDQKRSAHLAENRQSREGKRRMFIHLGSR